MRIVTEVLRWAFIALSSVVFLFWAYVASIDIHQHPPARSMPVWILMNVLICGLLPLIVAVVWVLRVHTLKYFGQGVLVLLGMLVFHYVLFAFSAHSDYFTLNVTAPSDLTYPLLQAAEFVLFGWAMWFLLRSPRGVG